jgi:hypothetical protein
MNIPRVADVIRNTKKILVGIFGVPAEQSSSRIESELVSLGIICSVTENLG